MAKASGTVRTDRARGAFLASLAAGHSVSAAAKAGGMGRTAAYNWRNDDEAFAREWDEAVEAGSDRLEDEATRRAVDGTLKPVFHQGKACGEIREYSNDLMMFMLKARRPAKYRERFEHSGPDGAPMAMAIRWLAASEK